MAGEAKRVRDFGGVIYPDSESYSFEEVLDAIQETFEAWAYICHDMDVDETGASKKPHVHWYGRFKEAKTVSSVAKKLGLAQNEIEIIKKSKFYLRYLIHADNPEKFQYQREQVTVSEGLDYNKYFGEDELARVGQLMEYITSTGCTSTQALGRWAYENGCWSEYRRCYAIWCGWMRENAVKE